MSLLCVRLLPRTPTLPLLCGVPLLPRTFTMSLLCDASTSAFQRWKIPFFHRIVLVYLLCPHCRARYRSFFAFYLFVVVHLVCLRCRVPFFLAFFVVYLCFITTVYLLCPRCRVPCLSFFAMHLLLSLLPSFALFAIIAVYLF